MDRPLFKGVFHLMTMISYMIVLPSLIEKIPQGLERPLKLYLFSIIGNFGASTLLHIIDWTPEYVIYPQRLDHVMIFVKIAATYYVAICTIMHDINPIVIYIIIMGTILGILIRLLFTQAPNIIIALPYLLVAWSALLDPYILLEFLDRIPIGFMLAIIGGLSYTIGAYIYMIKYPNPWPKYMGYHEIFHIFTIIGAVLFTICIFDHAIPYHVQRIYLR